MLYIYFFRPRIEFFCKIILKFYHPKHDFFNGSAQPEGCTAAMPCSYARHTCTTALRKNRQKALFCDLKRNGNTMVGILKPALHLTAFLTGPPPTSSKQRHSAFSSLLGRTFCMNLPASPAHCCAAGFRTRFSKTTAPSPALCL